MDSTVKSINLLSLPPTMHYYEHRKRWKAGLLMAALLIGAASLLYTHFLVQKLALEEKKKVELWAQSTQNLLKTEDNDFINFLFSEVINKTNFALILTDSNDVIKSYKGLDSTRTLFPKIETDKQFDSIYFAGELATMREQHEPLVYTNDLGEVERIYYKDSWILTQLKYYPYVQLAIIIIFFLAAYLAFMASTRSEQNRVWVGMAKETAHQLGTPISSLLAWVEHLRDKVNEKDAHLIAEMENDIKRLETVTERFSKIGSAPVLKPEQVKEVVQASIDYMSKRSSSKISFAVYGEDAEAELSIPLFDWVIENLCKNAINAITGNGSITATISKTARFVYVDISDTGKGIPQAQFETVFKPGFTTRKRGWGLGLSLVKRIVENYHQGKIQVKSSELGKGTTFRITLKRVNT